MNENKGEMAYRPQQIGRQEAGPAREGVPLTFHLSAEEMARITALSAEGGLSPTDYARGIITGKITPPVTERPYEENEPSSRGEADAVQYRGNSGEQIGVFRLSSAKVSPEKMESLIKELKNTCDLRVYDPEDMGYEEVEKLIKEKTDLL